MKKATDSFTIRSEKSSLMTPSDTDWAYAAGLYDGEGCVTVFRFKAKRINKTAEIVRGKPVANYHRWNMRVAMSNTSFELLKFLLDRFGGSLHGHTFDNHPRRKRQYQWLVANRTQALYFLNGIRPYVRYKAEEVDLAIEFFSGYFCPTGKHLGQDEIDRRQRVVEKIRAIPGRRRTVTPSIRNALVEMMVSK